MLGKLESRDFETYLSQAALAERDGALAANAAFTAALNRQIGRGREKAVPGTFIDLTPSYARTLRGESFGSGCGSPAAMCVESARAGGFVEVAKASG